MPAEETFVIFCRNACMNFTEHFVVQDLQRYGYPSFDSCFNQVRIFARLGSGASGHVFLAKDSMFKTQAPVALKLIDPVRVEHLSDCLEVEHLGGEALAFSCLKKSPYLIQPLALITKDPDKEDSVRIHTRGDLSQLDGQVVVGVVYEYFHSVELQAVIDCRGPLPISCVRSICRKLAMALVFFHSQGIIYRDVKARNILVGKGWDIRLTDFGSLIRQEDTSLGVMEGTPAYTPPEAKESHSDKFDVYSFGIVLYQLLCGKLPIDFERRTLYFKYFEENQDLSAAVPLEFPKEQALAFELFSLCTTFDSQKRITMSQALTHPFLDSKV